MTSTEIYLNTTQAFANFIMNTNHSNLSSQNPTAFDSSSLADLCQNFHLIVFLCIIFVLIVSANISVIVQLSCSKNRHSRMSFFLLNLAYAGTISYNSSYVLVCVSIDRLYAIIRPMDVRTASSTFRYSLIVASWVISMTFASAQLYLRDIEIIRGMPICGNRSDVENWNAYVYFLFISLYLVPLIVMTVSYVIIIVIIWKKSSINNKDHSANERNEKSRFRRFLATRQSTNRDGRQIESSIRNARSLGVIPRAKIKTVKMTLVIVIAFTACWSPYFLLMMMNSLNLIQNYLLIRVTSSLCYMNSLANPLIYWLFATNFCLRCRQTCGCNPLTQSSLDGLTGGGDRCSLTESRYSINSAKQTHRRSNYRSVTSQATKRLVHQQNSQSSIVYTYHSRH